MTRIRRIPAFVMIFLLISVAMAYVDDKDSLQGLKGVDVLVEFLEPDIEKDGLNRSSIKTDVELKLRMAGIKVLTREEKFKEPGMPYLYVNVNAVKRENEFYVYYIIVELKQGVSLMRDPKIFNLATTWEANGIIGIVYVNDVNSLRDTVKDRVDKFINDYLEMNPKE